MGIFSAVSNLGLDGYDASKILESDKSTEKSGDSGEQEQKTPEELEKEMLLDKAYECPVCGLTFKTKIVRAGKARLEGKDTDLRPIYKNIDPVKYDVVTCDQCGYSAIGRYFGKLMNRQIRDIREQVGARFSGIEPAVGKDIFTYDDAITRYQLALVTSIVKKAKNSERAYTCLKYAWALRGKRLSLTADSAHPAKPEEIRSLYSDEQECLQNAYEGFVKAVSSEEFPIAGMDENTLNYLMADLARRLGRYGESTRLLSLVITSRSASSHMKDEALKLKDLIRDTVNKKNH